MRTPAAVSSCKNSQIYNGLRYASTIIILLYTVINVYLLFSCNTSNIVRVFSIMTENDENRFYTFYCNIGYIPFAYIHYTKVYWCIPNVTAYRTAFEITFYRTLISQAPLVCDFDHFLHRRFIAGNFYDNFQNLRNLCFHVITRKKNSRLVGVIGF